jgi:hypothetical protein
MTATMPIAGTRYKSWNRDISSGRKMSATTCTVCKTLLGELTAACMAKANMIDMLDKALSSDLHADFQLIVDDLNATRIALDLANEQYRQHVASHAERSPSTLTAGWSS